MKHGAFSREMMLWGETAKDYEALRNELYAEWAPSGKTEEYKVDTLTKLMWRRRRVDEYWQLKTAQQKKSIESTNANSDKIVKLRATIPAFKNAKSVEEVELVLAEWHPSWMEVLESTCPREKCEDLTKWGSQIAAELEKMEPPKKFEGADQFVKIVSSIVVIDEEWITLERIDAAIDRVIKSLVQIKSIKQILPGNMMPKATPQKLTNTVSPQVIDGVVNDNVQNQSAQA